MNIRTWHDAGRSTAWLTLAAIVSLLPAVRTAAADAPDFERLVAALNDKDFRAREEALVALGETRNVRAVAPLLDAMKHPENFNPYWVAGSLARIGPPAVELLVAALKDPDENVRAVAAEALGRIRDPRAIEPLMVLLKQEPPEPPAGASKKVGLVLTVVLTVPTAVSRALANLDRERVLPLVEAAMNDPAPLVRRRAAATLGALGGEECQPLLLAALKDKDAGVRADAAAGLGGNARVGVICLSDSRVAPEAVEPLMEALNDEAPEVRLAAAYALREAGDDRAVLALRRVLDDPYPGVRLTAICALGNIKGEEALTALITQLKDRDEKVRSTAAGALGDQGDPRAVEPLAAALKDPVAGVRAAVAHALGGRVSSTEGIGLVSKPRFGPPSGAVIVPALLAALNDADAGVRSAAASSLGAYKDERILGPLLAALKDAHPDVRSCAITSLGILRDPRAVEPLISVLNDKQEPVHTYELRAPTGELYGYSLGNRTLAARALGQIKDPRAVEPLIAALKADDPDEPGEIVAVLGLLKDSRAFDSLVAALKDPDSQVRQTAAWALSELADPRAEAPLTAALFDPNPMVRDAVKQAVETLRNKWSVPPVLP